MILHPTSMEIKSVLFDSLTFAYEGTERSVFEELSFEAPMNRNVFVHGTAGTGQSTFLKILAVLLQPQSGGLIINGRNTAMMSFEEFLPYRFKIGYSFDFGGLFANRTLIDNLTLPLLYHKVCSPEAANERAMKLAEEFDFERQQHQRPAMVSGGLRKLICVLRAFIMRPELAVLDDPFTGIGMDASRKLVRLIQERRESGELKHVFLTSRDEVWPHWIGCDALFVDRQTVRFEERKAA